MDGEMESLESVLSECFDNDDYDHDDYDDNIQTRKLVRITF